MNKKSGMGLTKLASGRWVSKDSMWPEIYGHLDELNALLGLVTAATKRSSSLYDELKTIQQDLIDFGSFFTALTCKSTRRDNSRVVLNLVTKVKRLHHEVTHFKQSVTTMAFLLPGKNELDARLHVARAVCRRVERLFVHYQKKAKLPKESLFYLNTLNTWLFLAAEFYGNGTN